jgi:hypothetical protein
VEMWRGHSYAAMNFFLPVDSVSCWQSAYVLKTCSERPSDFSVRKMTEKLEQQYCIRFCCTLGDTQVETIRQIQQFFGDDAMSTSRIKEWYNRFKNGHTSVYSEPRSGRPSTSRNENAIEQVQTAIMQDHRITVREIATELGVSIGSVHSILTENLHMRRVSTKFVPKRLTMEQKQCRLDMLDNANRDPNFLNTVITGDETWVYGYDPEMKMQSSLWKHPTSPRLNKARQVRSNVKVMLTIFFDSCGS